MESIERKLDNKNNLYIEIRIIKKNRKGYLSNCQGKRLNNQQKNKK